MTIERKMKIYQVTALTSLLFALVGFSYNAWRLEVSESNATIRTASFQMLLELGNLEQLVYALHYDKSTLQGNLRTGWVKVGLIQDLSMLSTVDVQATSKDLHQTWNQHSNLMPAKQSSATAIIESADALRTAIKESLANLP